MWCSPEVDVISLHNYTPHEIAFYRPEDVSNRDGSLFVRESAQPFKILPTLGIARASQHTLAVDKLDCGFATLDVMNVSFGELENLPPPSPGVIYVVSAITHQAALTAGRKDTVMVYGTVRNEDGQIVGCTGLSR